MVGLNNATISDIEEQGVESKARNGIVGGVYLTYPVSSTLAFQPELLFAQRGTEASFSGDPTFGNVDATLNLNYVEVPLLLRLDVPTASTGFRPHLYAGPSLAFNTSCSFEADVGGFSGSSDCEDADEEFSPKSFDAGAMIGGGIAFPFAGGRQLTVGARYTFGLTNVFEDTGDVKPRHRVLAVYGAFDLPFGR
jgi:hypothetical protein